MGKLLVTVMDETHNNGASYVCAGSRKEHRHTACVCQAM